MKWEVRTNNNPDALPLGDSTVSEHNTPKEAFQAINEELLLYARGAGAFSPNSYLVRIVVEVDDNGQERRVIDLDDDHPTT